MQHDIDFASERDLLALALSRANTIGYWPSEGRSFEARTADEILAVLDGWPADVVVFHLEDDGEFSWAINSLGQGSICFILDSDVPTLRQELAAEKERAELTGGPLPPSLPPPVSTKIRV